MNIDFIDGVITPIITAACMCVGFVMSKWARTTLLARLNDHKGLR